MAVLGGFAAIAALGGSVTLIDIILGASLNGGITFGIATLLISQKSAITQLAPKSILRESATKVAIYDEMEIPTEMKDFLDSLEIVPGRLTGWYKDPSNLYKLRYFQNGKWTLAVSDSDSENEKSEALSRVLKFYSSNKMIKPTQSTT